METIKSHFGSNWTPHNIPNWKWQALCGLPRPLNMIPNEPWPTNGAKAKLVVCTTSEMCCQKNQNRNFWSRVEYDSILNQQSISGKIYHKFDFVRMEAIKIYSHIHQLKMSYPSHHFIVCNYSKRRRERS